MNTADYVFIGFNGLFGDYADIVHACGGRLVKVVVNLPLETRTATRTFAEQLASYEIWRSQAGFSSSLELQQLRDFTPSREQIYILACRGKAIAPLRDYLVQTLGITLPPLVHPSAIISSTVELPQGIIIHSQVHIGADVKLGSCCSIKSGSYLGHDSVLGEFVDLSPGVSLASGAIIEDNAQLGIRSTVLNGIRVGHDSIVAGGAVVTRDVWPYTMVAGVPAVEKKVLAERAVSNKVAGLE